jgi:tripartite-type tricarboxylate transporter receptor subunit TctC
MKIWLKRTTVFLATTLAMGLAHAQVDKPIKILVGFPPGGSADMAARLVGERMAAELKQPVIIENKPGAGGRIAAEALKNANPDGTTLLLTPVVVPVLAPLVFSKLPYNPSTDFAPVAQIATFQFSLSVNAAHPAKTYLSSSTG